MGARLSLVAILDEMGNQIRSVMDDADWAIQVEPRMVLSPTPPSIDIWPGDPARDEETGGMGAGIEDATHGYFVNVRARVAPTDHEAGQEVLLALKDDADELNLVQALYDDATLNGYASDVSLVSESGFTLFTDVDPSKVYIGVLWRFLVIPAYS